jgi:hypothetical protein
MDSHSPLDYSRDRSLQPDRPATERPTEPPNGPANPQARIIELRNQAIRLVHNPKLERTNGSSALAQSSSQTAQLPQAPERSTAERREQRNQQPINPIGLQLRPEEKQLLLEVGKFRVISVSDLAQSLYAGNDGRLKRDLLYLRQNRLVDVHVLNARRDGRAEDVKRFEAVTLTKTARKFIEKNGDLQEGQRVYSGLVKPREAEHDCQIYRAYLKEVEHIESEGGRNPRVKLDFELKASVQRGTYLARKAEPDRDLGEIKAEIAQHLNLAVIENKVVIPDARIEYDLPSGATAQIDIEVATSAYRHGHIAGKAQAGFRLYMSHGDIGRLGAGVQDDHDLMSEILDF